MNQDHHEYQPAYWYALLIAITVVIVEALFGLLFGLVAPHTPIVYIGIITGVVLSTLAVFSIGRLRWWQRVGFWQPLGPRGLAWFAPLFLYGLLPLTAGIHADTTAIALGALAAVCISFWKLAAFGLMFVIFLPLGSWRAAALSGLLYGTMHLGGLLVGATPLPTVLLSLSYVLLGFTFAALRLRTSALWPAFIANALLLTTAAVSQPADTPNMVASAASVLPALIISALLAVYGVIAVFTVRPHRPPQPVSVL